jgi:hypothetical protein
MSCCLLLFRDGWNPKQVPKFMDHQSAAFTLATYVHLLPDDMPEPTAMTALVGGSIRCFSGSDRRSPPLRRVAFLGWADGDP